MVTFLDKVDESLCRVVVVIVLMDFAVGWLGGLFEFSFSLLDVTMTLFEGIHDLGDIE